MQTSHSIRCTHCGSYSSRTRPSLTPSSWMIADFLLGNLRNFGVFISAELRVSLNKFNKYFLRSLDSHLFIRRWIFNRKKRRKDVRYGKKKKEIKRKKKLNWNKFWKSAKRKSEQKRRSSGGNRDWKFGKITQPFSSLFWKRRKLYIIYLFQPLKSFFFSVKSWLYDVT